MSESPRASSPPLSGDLLLELIRRARRAENVATLRFLAVNDSHLLAPFQQSALWFDGRGTEALSGLTDIDSNAPYVQWLNRVCAHVAQSGSVARGLTAADLPPDLGAEWKQWLPAHALWIPFARAGDSSPSGGLLLVRDLPWRDIELRLLAEWIETWFCAWRAVNRPTFLGSLLRGARRAPAAIRRRPIVWTLLVGIVAIFPVHLSVLAPGELVPANPVAVRAPLDGVIKTFFVRTNEVVKAGQPVFAYDDSALVSKLDVAIETLRTAEAEQRQFNQQALTESRARASLAAAKGNVEEKRLEVEFLRQQLERNIVTAPRDGTAFVDDPSEWIGRPVMAGQRIMRIAEPEDREIEAWLPVGDAIVLPPNAHARLYLSASPLSPVSGLVHQTSYEAQPRPDGSYAYRVRARLDQPTAHRVGLKGTVRLTGRRVPLIYWVFRRPFAAVRQFVGL